MRSPLWRAGAVVLLCVGAASGPWVGCATGGSTPGDVSAGDSEEGGDGWEEVPDGGDVEEGSEGEGAEAGDTEAGDEGEEEDGGGETGCATAEECDDGVDCTLDSCDVRDGTCKNDAFDATCDDGNPCTGIEICDVVLGCIPGTPVDCADEFDCTVDSCDPLTTDCRHSPDHALCTAPLICDVARGGCVDPPTCAVDADCDDGDDCNGLETCGAGLFCLPGANVVCDDGVDCTVDTCDPDGAACSFAPNDIFCADSDLGNGGETCDPTAGCLAGTPVDLDDGIVCPTVPFTASTGRCRNAADDALCDDRGCATRARDLRRAVAGAAGTPPSCSDGIACTDDRCNPGTDRCVNTPNAATCSDGLFCNGPEVCRRSPAAGRTPPVCTDGTACTTDVRDPTASGGSGGCVSTAPDRDGDTYADDACTGTDW